MSARHPERSEGSPSIGKRFFAALTVTAILCFLLCTMLLAYSGRANPSSENVKKWQECEKTEECTSVSVGCNSWQPVNEKYTQEMREAVRLGIREKECVRAPTPAPTPVATCVAHQCVYTVKTWEQKGTSFVNQRILECLREAGMEMLPRPDVQGQLDNAAMENQLYKSAMEKTEKLIRNHTFSEDEPLTSAVAQAISCDGIAAEAKALKK